MLSRLACMAAVATMANAVDQAPVVGSVALPHIGFPVVSNEWEQLEGTSSILVGQASGDTAQVVLVNTTDPEHLVSVNSLSLWEFPNTPMVTGMEAFVSEEILVVVVTDDSTNSSVLRVSWEDETVTGSYNTSLVKSLSVSSTHAFITENDTVTVLAHVNTNEREVEVEKVLNFDCVVENAQVLGNPQRLFVACGKEFYAMLAVDPVLEEAQKHETSGVCSAFAMLDGVLYVTSAEDGTAYLEQFQLVDEEYRLVNTSDFEATEAPSVAVMSSEDDVFAFISVGREGIKVLNLSDSDAVFRYTPVAAETRDLLVKDSYVYAADSPSRLIAIDWKGIVVPSPPNDDDDSSGTSAGVIAAAVVVPVVVIAGLAGGYFYYKSKSAVAGTYSSM